MNEAAEDGNLGAARWRWLIWAVYFIAWTTMLVVPTPEVGTWTIGEDKLDLKYLFSKSLHVGAYAGLAVLTGWLRVPARWRWLLLFVLMAHGTATELIQTHVVSRTGCLEDVGFDNLGIALGLLLSWKWWSAAT
jgi:hypothetical protein